MMNFICSKLVMYRELGVMFVRFWSFLVVVVMFGINLVVLLFAYDPNTITNNIPTNNSITAQKVIFIQ